jgi:hypothetical protein
MAEQFYLELAIGEVEADTQREQRAQSAVGTPSAAFPRGGELAAPRPHANQNEGNGSDCSEERTDKIFTDLAKARRLATKSHLVNRPVRATASGQAPPASWLPRMPSRSRCLYG